jgi:hypothetical protein
VFRSRKYWLAPATVFQVKVTVEEVKVMPLTGLEISAEPLVLAL